MSVLHILNGDAMAGGLRQSGVPGDSAKWIDLFYEGPVSGDSGSESFRRARAKYLSSAGYGNRDSILQSLRDQDRLLARSHEYVEVVLWFEHDLFDQLLLARHLDWLSRNPSAASRVHLIQSNRYLGPMQPEELAALYPTRTPVTPLQVASGSEAWRAICADSPTLLERLVNDGPQPEVPFMHGALQRLLEEYPSTSCGLSRSERQMLRVLRDGTRSFSECFVATQRMEDRIFMGDWSFMHIARQLASATQPLLVVHDDDGDAQAAPGATLTLTSIGEAVLEGATDHIRVNGIDRWIGGVHLLGKDVRWRWDDRTGEVPGS